MYSFFSTLKKITLLLISLPFQLCAISLLFTAKPKEEGIYTWSLIPIYLFFLESLYISFCSCHSITTTSVNIIHDLKSSSYQTFSSIWHSWAPFPFTGHAEHTLDFITISVTAPFNYCSLHYVRLPYGQSLYLFSFLSILIPFMVSSKIMSLSTV